MDDLGDGLASGCVEHSIEGEARGLSYAWLPQIARQNEMNNLSGRQGAPSLAQGLKGDGEEAFRAAMDGFAGADTGGFDPSLASATVKTNEAVPARIALKEGAITGVAANADKHCELEGNRFHRRSRKP